ncbi:MAG: cistern family PEP-CTERM protein [Oculatellaceae cyanobacterium Prado106]|nr:cistern family PEP-CTERM protein [Oculatellaceae cyanobacterium Prado106]
MSKLLSHCTIGLAGVAIATSSLLALAPAASAFTFGNGTVGITTEDINKTFTVKFDGSVATQGVSGLTSEAVFKFLGFTPATPTTTSSKGKNTITTTVTGTIARFEITLKNTSSGAIGSRVSALGFNTDKTESAAGATGLFSNGVIGGSLPNQFGNVDVCYTNGNTCQGGQNGGVSSGSAPDSFIASLTLDGTVNQLTLSNLGVRYQSISGTNLGTSGTGKAVLFQPPTTPPKEQPPKRVPEPAIASALIVSALVASRMKKQPKTQEA